jgi:O-antigen/teichoic acid export membrane protein
MRITEIIHFRIFGHEISDAMRDFLKNLSWSFLGGGIAAAVMMAVNILAGRLMGPIGYGEYGLVLAISQIFIIPIILGLDVSGVRSISMATEDNQKAKNISSVFYFVIFSSVVFVLIFLASHTFISEKFNINGTILLVAVLYSIISSFRSITDSFARSLFLFKAQFLARIVEVGTVVALFSLFFFYYQKQNYIFYIFSLLGGSLVFFIFLFRRFLQYLTRFDFQSLKKQLSYSSILLLGTAFGAVYISLEKIIIVKYLSLYDLGIYMAYYVASSTMITQVILMFANVFFPSVAKISAKLTIVKLEKLFRIFFIPTFLIISGIIFIIVYLFGKDYEMNYGYVFGFGLLATLQIILSINYYIFAASSKKLYKKYVFCVTLINFFQIVVYGVLIYFKIVSIGFIIILTVINSITNVTFQKRLIINDKN